MSGLTTKQKIRLHLIAFLLTFAVLYGVNVLLAETTPVGWIVAAAFVIALVPHPQHGELDDRPFSRAECLELREAILKHFADLKHDR